MASFDGLGVVDNLSVPPAAELPIVPRSALWATFHFIYHPLELFRRLADEYGDPFRLSMLDGTSVITGNPALLREIFSADPGLFTHPSEIVTPLLGERSIIRSDGERHRRKREMIMPPFHGARMRHYGQIIQDAALRATAGVQHGTTVAVLDITQRLSLDIIVRAIFGVRGENRISTFQRVISNNIAAFPAWLMFLPVLHRGIAGLGPWDRHQRRVDELKALLREEIKHKRAEAAAGNDVLSLLLAARDEDGYPMPEEELIDELRTLIIAGHETTATTLAWALLALHRHPAELARLVAELAPLGDRPLPEALAKLPYLTAVCDEVMRLHPIVPIIRRQLTQSWRLGNYDLPAGTVLSPCPMIAHFDPRVYPDPLRFRPERFLERSYAPHEYMPFGGGSRRCLGAAFASYELRIALGTLIAAHTFALVSKAPVPIILNGVTTRPRRGIKLRYTGTRAG